MLWFQNVGVMFSQKKCLSWSNFFHTHLRIIRRTQTGQLLTIWPFHFWSRVKLEILNLDISLSLLTVSSVYGDIFTVFTIFPYKLNVCPYILLYAQFLLSYTEYTFFYTQYILNYSRLHSFTLNILSWLLYTHTILLVLVFLGL